jgi:beta-glucosidase
MTDMDVATGEGRTYRYFKGKALFEFGDGLSYTTFHHLCSCAAMQCSCTVTNTGASAGDEVVMVYDSMSDAIRTAVGKAHPLPIKRLVDFQRVSLAAGASATLTFSITAEMLRLTTADGSRRSYAGMHNLVFSRGNGNDQTVPVVV